MPSALALTAVTGSPDGFAALLAGIPLSLSTQETLPIMSGTLMPSAAICPAMSMCLSLSQSQSPLARHALTLAVTAKL